MSTMSTDEQLSLSSAPKDIINSLLKLITKDKTLNQRPEEAKISVTDLEYEKAKEENAKYVKNLQDSSSHVRKLIDGIQSGVENLTKMLEYPMAPLKSTRLERLLMEQNVIVNHALFRFRVDYRRDELIISLKHRINDAFITMGFKEIPTSKMLLLSGGPESTILEPNWELIWHFTRKGPEPFEIVLCNLEVVDELLKTAQLQFGRAVNREENRNSKSKSKGQQLSTSNFLSSKKPVIDKNAGLLMKPREKFILPHNSQTLYDQSPLRLAKMPGYAYIQPKPGVDDGKTDKKIPSPTNLKPPFLPSTIAQPVRSSQKTNRRLTCIHPKSTFDPKLVCKLPPRWKPKSENDSFNICIASPPITVKTKREKTVEVNVDVYTSAKRMKIVHKNIVPDSRFDPQKGAPIPEVQDGLRNLAGSGNQLFFPASNVSGLRPTIPPQINKEPIRACKKEKEPPQKPKVPVTAARKPRKPLPPLEPLENYQYASVPTNGNEPSRSVKADDPKLEEIVSKRIEEYRTLVTILECIQKNKSESENVVLQS